MSEVMNPDELRRWCVDRIIDANRPNPIAWPVLFHDAAMLEDWILNGLQTSNPLIRQALEKQ